MAVRARAIELPEPTGPRSGVAGEGRPLRLLITGDSSAAGVGAGTQTQALAGQLVSRLAKSARVEWQLEATTGHRTADTIARLSTVRGQFQVVVTALGVNDVTRAMSQDRFRDAQRILVKDLTSRMGAGLILASGVPPMEHFPALPRPLNWVLGCQAARLDTALGQLAAEIPEMEHLPFHLPPDPANAAPDGYHPSPKAYALWAERLAAKILAAMAARRI
ncbi:SGNH/GDSL hydrolase family protein [Primorskyibacter sp. S87]|uniref:SGNH/GDSL hydrolase family protein n=1 Tax=Primorskyibacter sp. S87 TaxID=3415126 RepID=UPI003C7CBF33